MRMIMHPDAISNKPGWVPATPAHRFDAVGDLGQPQPMKQVTQARSAPSGHRDVREEAERHTESLPARARSPDRETGRGRSACGSSHTDDIDRSRPAE